MKYLVSLLLSVISLAVSLVFVEVGVRYFISHQKPPFKSDRPPVYLSDQKSGNNADYWYSPEKPKDTFRIAAIGDSFTYGYRNLFDDAYPKRLERMLNLNEQQQKVEVLNMGKPGFSTAMEVDLVRKTIKKYNPDLILLQITLNDPEIHEYRAPRGALAGKDLKGEKGAEAGFQWRTWQLVAQRIGNTRSIQQYIDYYNNLFTDPETRDSFHKSLIEIKKICDASDVKLVATIFPLLSFPFDKTYPFRAAHEVAHQFLDELQIPYLDLLKSFKGMDPLRLQAIPPQLAKADPHPNEIALRIAAQSLYAWFGDNKFVPSDTLAKCYSRKRLGPAPLKCTKS